MAKDKTVLLDQKESRLLEAFREFARWAGWILVRENALLCCNGILGLSCKLRRMAVVFLDPFCYEYNT